MFEHVKAQAKHDIGEIEQSMQGKDRLTAAVQLVDATHKYSKLPDESKALGALLKEFKSDSEDKPFISQAEEIVKARGHARANRRDRATQSYELVIRKYPDSPAATLAKAELEVLQETARAEGATKRAK